ncbi:hypothetical protein JTE90_020164 [Oedothorax gibbosus]|uniref:Torsin-1A-interacting protein 1/2 AAA+ activator domain-containing protein n=1 Tax=Oedothorax gibbosus TaxID=931172 RepID=A0AAV6TX25_9ARAC|nr:hypothetical protein JTE90_020164 [Oedothorax gibbosus]
MDSGDYDSNEKSVHNSGNQCPSSVQKKSKGRLFSKANIFSSRKSGKQSTDKKDRVLAKKINQDSIVTSEGLYKINQYERLNKNILSNILLTNDNVPFNYQATQSEGDHNLPTYGISSGSCFNDALASVNCISHSQEDNNGSSDNSFSSLEFNQRPAEFYDKPQDFHVFSNPDTMLTNPTFSIHTHEIDLKDNLLGTTKKQKIYNVINPLDQEHNLESNDVTRQGGKLSNIKSNEDARPPTQNSSTTESTQSEDSFNYSNTLENVNLVEMCLSSSAPPTENTFARESSLPSCKLDNSVSHDEHKEHLHAASHTHTSLKPATSDCPAQLGININLLADSVDKKHNSVLKSGEAKPTNFYSKNSTRLQILNAVQDKDKLTDITKVLPENSGLENPDVENAISNQSDFTSKEKLNNEEFDITKARFYAWNLRSLPKDQLIEVEKEISTILFNSQISAATGLDESQAISMWHVNQLPSISKENLSTEPDIFDTKALSFINILKNLPKEKFEEVDKNISHILWQRQIALWEKSQENTDINMEYYTRQPLPFSWEKSAFQNQGLSSSRQENVVSNSNQSSEIKRIYSSISNMQDSKDVSNLEHERDTSPQENEKCSDDAIEAESFNEPPKKTVTTTTPVRKWTPREDKAVPKPSTSYKYVLKFVYPLIVLLCAIAAAIFGVTYWPKTLEGLSKTNLSPQPVADIMKNLKDEFGGQPPMTFNVISTALRRVTKPNPTEPAIILLLAEQGAEDVALRFARKIADSVSSANDMVVVPGYAYDTKDHDEAKKEIDDLLKENLSLDRLTAVLVERLDNIPPDVAGIFHTYCDHENASFKRVVYLMTIASNKTELKSLSTKDWDVIVGEHLSEAWIKGGNDQISSLLSRLTVSVAVIVSGG